MVVNTAFSFFEDDRNSILSHFSRIAFAGAGRDKTLVSSRIKGSEDCLTSQSPSLPLCVCMCSASGEWNVGSEVLFLEFKLCDLGQIMSLVFASVLCL